MQGAAGSRNAGSRARPAASAAGQPGSALAPAPELAAEAPPVYGPDQADGSPAANAASPAGGLAPRGDSPDSRAAAGPNARRGSFTFTAAWLDAVRRPRNLGRIAAGTRARCIAAARSARARWRRSLQLRVVTATLVISAVVVTVLGIFLIEQVADGLQKAKLNTAVGQTRQGLLFAEGQLGASVGAIAKPSGTTQTLLFNILSELEPGSTSSDFTVAIRILPAYQGPPVYLAGVTVGLPFADIPASLIQAVEYDQRYHPSHVSDLSTNMRFPGSDGPERGLLVGAPVGNYYQLYYFFPLTQDQRTLSLVQDTLLLAALALVFLLAGIAWLVTRWVVVPVARAAEGAQRLSTGNLDDRMQVRGTDELAALATSFNEMAASLQEKMAELEGLSHVQRQFVSDVSHELRTPLTTIRIAADLLFESRDQLDAAAGRSAELLQSQLERFESLLVDLLEISRYDAKAATLDAEPVDICDLARHAADVAQQLAERRGARIEFRLPAEPCVAEVDRRRVERVLRNLLVNAVEHGESRDAVVTVAGDRDAVAVSVRDYGVGLEPGEEQLVFDRFWRADPARARTTGGTGLGLSIALEDALLHGGWLEAWGEPGRGSVFRLTLPRRAGAELAGSPLPLGPDEAELASVLADHVGGVAGVAQGPTRNSALGPAGDSTGRGEASHG
jgi:two-component system sensor histidine kinase MtrB